jgi:hypothetical protein
LPSFPSKEDARRGKEAHADAMRHEAANYFEGTSTASAYDELLACHERVFFRWLRLEEGTVKIQGLNSQVNLSISGEVRANNVRVCVYVAQSGTVSKSYIIPTYVTLRYVHMYSMLR